MTAPAPAIALLRDGTRVVLSDPPGMALKYFREGRYADEVVAIEGEARAPPGLSGDNASAHSVGDGPASPIDQTPTASVQLALL